MRVALSAVPTFAAREAYRAAWVKMRRRLAPLEQALGRTSREPHAKPTAGLLPGEITRLRYPLHPGASWVIREEPRFAATVEGVEPLELPVGRIPAYRIRIDVPGLGENDRVHFWFARSGFLKLEVHVEGTATDNTGRPIGLLISDTVEELTGLTLVRPGRF